MGQSDGSKRWVESYQWAEANIDYESGQAEE